MRAGGHLSGQRSPSGELKFFSFRSFNSPPFDDLVSEQKHSYRLMNYIFLVDSSQAVFHRTRPFITLSELTGAFPCSEYLFTSQPTDSQTLHNPRSSSREIASIVDGVALLMQEVWTSDIPSRFGQLSYLDLFILVSGAYCKSRLFQDHHPFSGLRVLLTNSSAQACMRSSLAAMPTALS